MPKTTPAPQPEAPSVLKSTALVGGLTLLSRFAGLARDISVLRFFGAGAAADAFFMAFKIPNFFRRLFGEGAFSAAFVPVLAEYRGRGQHAVRALLAKVLAALGAVLLPLTLLVVVVPEVLTLPFALGYWLNAPEKFALTAALLQLTFPYLALMSLTILAGGVLNTYGRFAAPAAAPILLNLCLIGAAWLAAPWFAQPIFALGWAVLLAGLVQLAFQLPFLWRLHLLPAPAWGWRDPGVQRIIKLMLPAVVGASASQLNLMVDNTIASFLPTGSVTWLYQSDRLLALPLGVFAIAMATVIMPRLSAQHGAREGARFSATLDWSLRSLLLVAAPATLALLLLAEPILSTLFQYGAFGPRDVQMSAYSLRGYALSLAMLMMIKVLVPGYFARQDTRTPTRIGILALLVNAAASAVLVLAMYRVGLGHLGLAMSTSLAAAVNAALLLGGLLRAGVYRPGPGWRRFLTQLLLASAAMAVPLALGVWHWGDWPHWTFGQRLWRLAVLCGAGSAVYLGALFALGLRWRHLQAPREPDEPRL